MWQKVGFSKPTLRGKTGVRNQSYPRHQSNAGLELP